MLVPVVNPLAERYDARQISLSGHERKPELLLNRVALVIRYPFGRHLVIIPCRLIDPRDRTPDRRAHRQHETLETAIRIEQVQNDPI
jgi:hypothetical protein